MQTELVGFEKVIGVFQCIRRDYQSRYGDRDYWGHGQTVTRGLVRRIERYTWAASIQEQRQATTEMYSAHRSDLGLSEWVSTLEYGVLGRYATRERRVHKRPTNISINILDALVSISFLLFSIPTFHLTKLLGYILQETKSKKCKMQDRYGTK